jgi:hypothetical protein
VLALSGLHHDDGDKLAATVAGLGDDVRAKYVFAMMLGSAEVRRLVKEAIEAVEAVEAVESVEAVEAVVSRRGNLLTGARARKTFTRRQRRSLCICAFPARQRGRTFDVVSQDIVRYTVYGALMSSLGYGGGARVPLLVKLCFLLIATS